ncbi:MAG: hypothetical protein C0490_00230, partial [Marivirga sp.]|nr:hypothetical protein [Marivirga sp.]
LYHFLADMRNEDLASFIFPVSLVLTDGSFVSVENNSELRDIIKNSVGKCDEDDDNDHNDDDDIDEVAFVNILTEGEWIVSYFFDDGEDETSNYEQYTFTFAANGTFTANNATSQFLGEWEIRDDGKPELRLNIDEDALDELGENWKVMNFSTERIKLRDSTGGNPTYLTFERP